MSRAKPFKRDTREDWREWSRDRWRKQRVTQAIPDDGALAAPLYLRQRAESIAAHYRCVIAPDFHLLAIEARVEFERILRQMPEYRYPELRKKSDVIAGIRASLKPGTHQLLLDLEEAHVLECLAHAATGYLLGVEIGKRQATVDAPIREDMKGDT